MNKITPWGWHLLVNGRNGDLKKITDHENIKAFVADLIKTIDMVPYGETWVADFATHDPDKAGPSFFQMIETSHISGHLVPKDGSFYMDIFSCKPFDVSLVVTKIDEYFSKEGDNTILQSNFILRGYSEETKD